MRLHECNRSVSALLHGRASVIFHPQLGKPCLAHPEPCQSKSADHALKAPMTQRALACVLFRPGTSHGSLPRPHDQFVFWSSFQKKEGMDSPYWRKVSSADDKNGLGSALKPKPSIRTRWSAECWEAPLPEATVSLGPGTEKKEYARRLAHNEF